MDYSCYVRVHNNLDVELTCIDHQIGQHGHWEKNPSNVSANSLSDQFQTKDYPGQWGSDGWVKYRVNLKSQSIQSLQPVIKISFDCSTGTQDNTFTIECVDGFGTANFHWFNSDFDKQNHPLNVTAFIYWTDGLLTRGSGLTSVVIPNPSLNVLNTQNPPVNWYSPNVEVWNSTIQDTVKDDSPFHPYHVAGSFRPVSVNIMSPLVVSVKVQIQQDLVGVPVYLRALLDGYYPDPIANGNTMIYASKAGIYPLDVTVLPSFASKRFPWAVAGDLHWVFAFAEKADQVSVDLNSTRVEIYALTSDLAPFFANYVSVDVLRTCVARATDPFYHYPRDKWINWVVQAIFHSGIRYDVDKGEAHYVDDHTGGNFNMRNWTKVYGSGDVLVNAYDCAAIVQILLSFAPYGTSRWFYCQPWGFIKTAEVVGIGSCNNPRGTPAVVDNNADNRTDLADHAFLSIDTYQSLIADACIGPHCITEEDSQYMDASVQDSSETTLYAKSGTRPGIFPNDLQICKGVTSLDRGAETLSELSSRVPNDQVSNMMKIAQAINVQHDQLINLDMHQIHSTISSEPGFKTLFSTRKTSLGGTELSWVLNSDGDSTSIQIAILSNSAHAEAYFAAHLHKYQVPLDQLFGVSPDSLSKGRLCLTSHSHLSCGTIVWIHGNVFVHIRGPGDLEKLEKHFAGPIHQHLLENTTNTESQVALLKPTIIKVLGEEQSVKAGHEFTISFSIEDCDDAVVQIEQHLVRYLSQDPDSRTFRFRAETVGIDNLIFAFAHRQTGAVVEKIVKVEIHE